MTREEAIKTLKGEAWLCCAEKWNESLDMAINALKALDNIKAEAEEKLEAQDMSEDLGYGMCLGISLVLDILDKVMKEDK